MNTILRSVSLFLALLSIGCSTVKTKAPELAELGLAGAKMAAPQYAGVIDQIEKVIGSAKAKPDAIRTAIEAGFVYERTWYVNGEIAPQSAIKFEDVLRRSSGAADTAAAIERLDTETAAEAALAQQIEAIIRSSGVADE